MLIAAALATAVQRTPLAKIIDSCPPDAAARGGCGDLALPVWRTVVGVNGAETRLDIQSVQPAEQGVIVAIYSHSPGTLFDLSRLHRLHLTCRGGYEVLPSVGVMYDAPPASVAGQLAAIACPIGDVRRREIMAERARADAIAHDQMVHPNPAQFCQGFDADACARITAGVRAPVAPSYCRPGFGQEGSALSDEMLRICYARPRE